MKKAIYSYLLLAGIIANAYSVTLTFKEVRTLSNNILVALFTTNDRHPGMNPALFTPNLNAITTTLSAWNLNGGGSDLFYSPFAMNHDVCKYGVVAVKTTK